MRTIWLLAVLVAALQVLARADEFAPDRFGVGAVFVQADSSHIVEIRRCAMGGPADRAGLLPGDQVIALDGQSTREWSFQQVRDYVIRSEPLPLRITVLRDGEALSFELVRARFADIAAGIQMRWEAVEGHGYRQVPLHERPQLSPGDTVPLDSLFDASCRPQAISTADTTTVLYFWASWCGPCKEVSARIAPHTDLRLICVNMDATCADFTAALAGHHRSGVELWAGGRYGPLAQSLGIYYRGIPSAALLEDGRLVRVVTGVTAVVALIGERGGPRPRE